MITRYIVEWLTKPFWAKKATWYSQDEFATKQAAERYIYDNFSEETRKNTRIRMVRIKFNYVEGKP